MPTPDNVWIEPVDELRAALDMVYMALAEFVPLPPATGLPREQAEVMVAAIRGLAETKPPIGR